MAQLDLTPFGFTPTESLAYCALTELGPQTGYGLARSLSIARANAYQALRGLVAKGAVAPTDERPARYRPLQPSALLATVAQREAGKLDRLEAQLSHVQSAGTPGIVAISGERSLLELALRAAARAAGPVTCIAPAKLLVSLAPAWHKRAANGEETRLWYLGEAPVMPLPVEPAGQVDAELSIRHFASPILLLVAPESAVIAALPPDAPTGFWTSDPVLRATARAAAELLTRVDTTSLVRNKLRAIQPGG